jgi:hypothetical protein
MSVKGSETRHKSSGHVNRDAGMSPQAGAQADQVTHHGPCALPCAGFVGVSGDDGYQMAPCPCRLLFPRISWTCPVTLPSAPAPQHADPLRGTGASGFEHAPAPVPPVLLQRAQALQLAWIPVAAEHVASNLSVTQPAVGIRTDRQLGLCFALEAIVLSLPALQRKSLEDLYPGKVVEATSEQRSVLLNQHQIWKQKALRASSNHFVVLGSELPAVVGQGFQVRRAEVTARHQIRRSGSSVPLRLASLHDLDPSEIRGAMTGRCVFLCLTTQDVALIWRSEARRSQLTQFIDVVDSCASGLVVFSSSPLFTVGRGPVSPQRVGGLVASSEGRESYRDAGRKLRFRSARLVRQEPTDLALESLMDSETFATLLLLLSRGFSDVVKPALRLRAAQGGSREIGVYR